MIYLTLGWAFIKKLNWKVITGVIILLVFCFLSFSIKNLSEKLADEKADKNRVLENASMERKADSIGYSQELLTKTETIEYMKYNDPELLASMDEMNIKIENVLRVVDIRNNYRDTITQTTIIKEMPRAIEEGRQFTVPFRDSTDCLVVYGVLHFNGQDLELNVTDRKYKSETDIIAHLERSQWKLLGIKTRLFGKRKITVTVVNSCGETTTKIIDIQRSK